jgi:Fe2+ transport system protein FeoA/gas vesicle protein
MIKKLPKGDIILEFIENVLGSIKQKLSELASYMKEKISEWKKSAKKTIIDFFINTLMLSDEFKEDLYSVMGVTEEDVEQAQNEMRNRGINTLNELHLVWEAERLLTEAAGRTYIFENDVEDSLKVLGVLENPPDGEEGSVDPAEFLRGKAGSVIEFLFDKFAELADKNFLRYMQPLFDSSFFKPFESGFGLAAAGFMGIVSMGSLSWDGLVKFVESISKGFKAKEKKAGKAGRAVRFLFTGDGASLLKELVVGIVTGSNLEVIIRALMGDPTQIAEATKRLIGAIMGAVRKAIKENIRPALQATVDGEVGDEAEEQIGELMGGYIDDFFEPAS